MTPKTFLRYFPEAKLDENLPLEAPSDEVKLIIRCRDLDTLKQKLSQLGYCIEIKKIES